MDSEAGRSEWTPPPSEQYQQQNPGWDNKAPDPTPEQIDGDWWLSRELPRPKPLLGEVICSTTRMLLGGPTGAGKTHVAMAIAAAVATGQSKFLHWMLPGAPLSVLYVDGEMARDLIQDRMRDLHRRLDGTSLGNLHMLCREDFPAMQGLNTELGRNFLLAKIKEIKPALVILDSRMCLLVGDMKDEIPWNDTMPLVWEITKQGRAQIWLDHTGHYAGHIYGSKVKEWQMDVVALFEKQEAKGTDINVRLKFTKARRRRPETSSDFVTITITLRQDQWFSAPDENDKGAPVRVRPSRLPFYEALLSDIDKSDAGRRRTTIGTWQLECLHRGLIEKGTDTETTSQRRTRLADWNRSKSDLMAAKWIAIDGDRVVNIKGG